MEALLWLTITLLLPFRNFLLSRVNILPFQCKGFHSPLGFFSERPHHEKKKSFSSSPVTYSAVHKALINYRNLQNNDKKIQIRISNRSINYTLKIRNIYCKDEFKNKIQPPHIRDVPVTDVLPSLQLYIGTFFPLPSLWLQTGMWSCTLKAWWKFKNCVK